MARIHLLSPTMAKKLQQTQKSDGLSKQEKERLKSLYAVMMPAARKQGKPLSAGGAIKELYRVDSTGIGARVLDGSLYTVMIIPETDGWYEASCSCSIAVDCKHIAALLDLLVESEGRSIEFVATPTTQTRQAPLAEELAKRNDRALTPKEKGYVRRLLDIHSKFAASGTLFGVSELTGRFVDKNIIADLVLPPTSCDVGVFWSYLAYQFRSVGVELPEFMRCVENEPETAAAIAVLRRQKEIEAWEKFIVDGPVHETTLLDCRVSVDADGLQLEHRSATDGTYIKVKRSQVRQWMTEYENGKLMPAPGCEGVFMAFREDWVARAGHGRASSVVAAALRAAARDPGGRGRIVNASGEVFEWFPEPLHWAMAVAEDDQGNHALELAPPGSNTPIGPPLIVMDGTPSLYVTKRVIYEGPRRIEGAPGNDDKSWTATRVEIPAPALTSQQGVRYLMRLGVPLPENLTKRIRRVPLRAHLHITTTTDMLAPENGETEIQVTAVDPREQPRLRWTGVRWVNHWKDSAREEDESLIVVQDETSLPDIPALMAPLGGRWSVTEEILRIRMTRGFPDRFGNWLQTLPAGITTDLPEELGSFQAEPIRASIRLDCSSVRGSTDWFDLRVIVNVDDTQLTPEELRALLEAKGRFVNLKGKGWRRLMFDISSQDEERLADLGLAVDEFSGAPQRLHAVQLADPATRQLLARDDAQKVERRVADLKLTVEAAVPKSIQAELRHYQVDGFRFLAYLAENGFGGILADDMGLGKTLQSLTWLVWLRERAKAKGGPGPSLVICPKSVMANWAAEGARFAPGLKISIWRGTDAAGFSKAAKENDLLVMNYAQLRGLSEIVTNQQWLAVLLDEGQYIKNPESQTAKVAGSVNADHRVVLTGTPIENRLLDLWSLMEFAMPGVLGGRAGFLKTFDKPDDPLGRRRLTARVRPFMLRRTKAAVAPELPPRVEEDLIFDMTEEQGTLYRAELKRAQQMLLRVQTQKQFDKERFNFLTSLLRLRQISCDPALVGKPGGVMQGAKVEALMDLLEPLMEEGHKVLVFSQFVSMIERLEPAVKAREWPCYVLTGQTEERGELVKKFQGHEGAAVFMISLKAGGFGLNLTSASYVVLFDPWWNPAVENQAIDRTHRIGQTRHVMAYRLIMKGTIEEKIRQLQHSKSALATDVLGEEGLGRALTLDDLKFLLSD